MIKRWDGIGWLLLILLMSLDLNSANLTRSNGNLIFTEDYTTSEYLDPGTLNTYLLSWGSGEAREHDAVTWCWDGPLADIAYDKKNSVVYAVSELYMHSDPYADLAGPNRSEVFLYKFDEWGNMLWNTSVWVSTRTDIYYGNVSKYPSITVDTNGYIYVMWTDRSASGTYGIYAQKFDPAGTPLWNGGKEIVVNSGVDNWNVPRGACISNYLFVTYWNSSDTSIYIRRINTSTGAVGSAVQVDSSAAGGSQYADIAAGPDNNLYIVWRDSRNGRWDIYLQKMDTTPAKLLGSDLRVNVYTNYSYGSYWYGGTEDNVAIDVDANTNIYVAWVLQKSGMVKTFAQKLDKNLQAKWTNGGEDVQVSTGADLNEAYCSIKATEGNAVYVSWIAHGTGNNDHGILQKLDKSDGSQLWSSDIDIRNNYGFYHHGRIDVIGNTCITFGNDSTYQRFSETGVRFFNDYKELRDRLYYTRARYGTLKILPGVVKKIRLTEDNVIKPSGATIQYRFSGNGGTSYTPYYPATNGTLELTITNMGNDFRMFAYMDNETNRAFNTCIMSQISITAVESYLGDFNVGIYNTGQLREGDLIINSTAEGQEVVNYTFNNGTNSVDCYFFLKNNGNIATNFKIKGHSAPANWTFRYYLCKYNGSYWETNRNITSDITGAGFTTNVSPYSDETNIITIKLEAVPDATLSDGDFTIVYLTNYAQFGATWYLQDVAALRATVTKANPDIMVGKYTNAGAVIDYAGDNIYNSDGTGQSKLRIADTNFTAIFFIKIENDGNDDTIYVKGDSGDANWDVKYYSAINGGTDITIEVTSSTGKPWSLSASQSTQIRVQVTPLSGNIGDEKIIMVSATSKTNSTREDKIKITTRLVRSKPDIMVRFVTNSSFTGDDVYNTNMAGQSITNFADNGMTNTFIFRVENEGSETMSFYILTERTTGLDPNWNIKYFYNANDITSQITNQGYVLTNIGVGNYKEITVKVAPPLNFPDGANEVMSVSLLAKSEAAFTQSSKFDKSSCSTKAVSSRPDLIAVIGTNYYGRDIIESHWSNQTPFRFINHFITNYYSVIITNTAPSAYRVKIYKTEENNNNWSRNFTYNGTNIGTSLDSGWESPVIPAYSKKTINIAIAPSSVVPADTTNGIILKLVSSINTNDIDMIKFRTSRIFPPDLLIKKTNESVYSGDGEYGTNVASQGTAGSYSTNYVIQGNTNDYWYLVKLQNDRTLPDSFNLLGTDSDTNWMVTYWQYKGTNIDNPEVTDKTKWTNITDKITSTSGYTLYNISGGSNILFKIGVRATNTNINEGDYIITQLDAYNLASEYIDRVRMATTYGIARPDLIVFSNWNNTYETNPSVQIFTNYVDKAAGYSFNFIVENESPINVGTFIMKAKKSTNDWVLKYYDGTSDVTPQFTSPSGYTKALPVQSFATLTAVVSVKTDAYYTNREQINLWFKVYPEDGESLVDVGSFVAIVTDMGKPDIVLTNGSWDNVYENTPSVQILNSNIEKGVTNSVVFLIQNDRLDVPEKLRLTGDGTSGDFQVEYFYWHNSQWSNVTSLLTGSEFDLVLSPNTSATMKMTVYLDINASTPIGSMEDFFVHLKSQGREKQDNVEFDFTIVDLGKPDIAFTNGVWNDIRESTPVVQITNFTVEKGYTKNIYFELQNDKNRDEYLNLKSFNIIGGSDFDIEYFIITNATTNDITTFITNTSGYTLYIKATSARTLCVGVSLISNSSYTFQSNIEFTLQLKSQAGNVADTCKITTWVTDLGRPDLIGENSQFSNIFYPSVQSISYYVEKERPFTNYFYARNSLDWRAEDFYLKASAGSSNGWDIKYYDVSFNQITPNLSEVKIEDIPPESSATLAVVMTVLSNSTNRIGDSFNTTMTLFSAGKLVKDCLSFNYVLTDRGAPNIKLTNNLWDIYSESGAQQRTNIRIEKGESNRFTFTIENDSARVENMVFKISNFKGDKWDLTVLRLTNTIWTDITTFVTDTGYKVSIPNNSDITMQVHLKVATNTTNQPGFTNKLFLQLYSQAQLKKDTAILNYLLCSPRPDLVIYNLAVGRSYGTNSYITNLADITNDLFYESSNENIAKGTAIFGQPAVYLLKIENDDKIFDEINVKVGGDGQIAGKWSFNIYDESDNNVTSQFTNWNKVFVPANSFRLFQVRVANTPEVDVNEIHRLYFECYSTKNTNRKDKIGLVTKRLPIVVKGRIVWAKDKSPIENAIVKIGNTSSYTSDKKGEFMFESLEGTYPIEVRKEGYIPYQDEITIVNIKTNILDDIELLKFNLNVKKFDVHTFPNPTEKGRGVNIVFNLPQKDTVTLKIFDRQGRLVKTILENQQYEKGSYKVYWDGRNEQGKIMSRDVYVYVIKTSKERVIKKIFVK